MARSRVHDVLAHRGLECPRHFVGAELESGQRVVMPHAAHPEPELVQRPPRRCSIMRSFSSVTSE